MYPTSPKGAATALLWLALLGGAVLIATKVIQTSAHKAQAAI